MKFSRQNWTLTLGAIGVVFGDIGTSPIYALRECLAPGRGVELTSASIEGVVSILIWTLVLVVSVKYLAVVLRADNQGEGGVLSLVSLISSPWAIAVGLVGAALLFADGMLTPAVSVLSALEGLELISPSVQSWIPAASIVVLVVLFAVQAKGTGKIAGYFGPVIVIWFLVLATLGLISILKTPQIVHALNPMRAIEFASQNPLLTFGILGYVFLAVTGTEALYADLGHFGKGPIRWGWYALTFPALILNYLGQGAAVLSDPTKTENLFFQLAPSWALVPLVVIATLATVIASQAIVTGAFSLARQSVQMGLLPRMLVRHTSDETIGQVYVPVVNAVLFLGTVFLVAAFRESGKLADAYGIAVSGTMLLTTVLLVPLAQKVWKLSWWIIVPAVLLFATIDLIFFAANITKLFSGGWPVLVTAAILILLMVTWRRGRRILKKQYDDRLIRLPDLVKSLQAEHSSVLRVERAAVYLSSNPNSVPASLLHNLKHNHVLHNPVYLVSVETADVPHVSEGEMAQVTSIAPSLFQIRLRYGFSQMPDVPLALAQIEEFAIDVHHLTYFLGKESLVRRDKGEKNGGMPLWQTQAFIYLSRNALDATAFFSLPAHQVVELGGQTKI